MSVLIKFLNLMAHKQNYNAPLFIDWMRKCYVGNGVQLMSWVEQFAELGRENQKHFFRYALHFMREYLQLQLIGDQAVRLREKELTADTVPRLHAQYW